jgi:hypothetical protein
MAEIDEIEPDEDDLETAMDDDDEDGDGDDEEDDDDILCWCGHWIDGDHGDDGKCLYESCNCDDPSPEED